MRGALVIGYGNPYRCDDGVALSIVNQLRALQGRPVLQEGLDGLDELGEDIDTIFLQQLTPELAETIAQYEEIIFVDAHLGQIEELVREVALEPAANASALVSHHLRPGALLALAQALWGHAPHARLISVRGHTFDFGTQLSPETRTGSEDATARIWGILTQ